MIAFMNTTTMYINFEIDLDPSEDFEDLLLKSSPKATQGSSEPSIKT